MNDTQRLNLVGATLKAGEAVMTKSASAGEEQKQILEFGWPKDGEQISKTACLARMLGTGLMVEEAEAALTGA